MTNRRNDDVSPAALSIEELIRRSSVGGDLDPELEDGCTDEEAARFAAKARVPQSSSPVPQAQFTPPDLMPFIDPAQPPPAPSRPTTITGAVLPGWAQLPAASPHPSQSVNGWRDV